MDTGEVEATLAEHQGIKEAVVVAQEDRLGNNELVAHIVTRNGVTLDTSALRKFLHDRLPEYMIPVHFVKADNFPLTATGKVDRFKLAALDIVRLESSSDYVAPRTLLEEKIAAIWREILSLERIGVHDNFFELGGHSLSATQVVSRIRDTFDFDLPLKTLFETRTIAALAEQVDTHSIRNSTSHQPPISPIVRDHYKTKRST